MRSLVARIWTTTGGRTVLALAAFLIVIQVWAMLSAPGKIDPDVWESPDARGRVDVMVELRFAPERFHILTMQDHGRVTGTEENAIQLRAATPGSLDEIARLYWVKEIRPLGS